MPMLIDSIDKIARQVQRDVLLIQFYPNGKVWEWGETFDWERSTSRKRVIKWLDGHQIPWRPCHVFWKDGLLSYPYLGDIYVDIPFDRSNTLYLTLEAYLENPDGTMRSADVIFAYLPLSAAMKNAHHDEEAYWDEFW